MIGRRYPTINGLPVPLSEIWLPHSSLAESRRNRNNHHSCWTASRMGRLLVTQTLRDLESYQDVIPLDTHEWIHDEYEPPQISLAAAYDRVIEAYDLGERLRRGSANHPEYSDISAERIHAIKLEYDRL